MKPSAEVEISRLSLATPPPFAGTRQGQEDGLRRSAKLIVGYLALPALTINRNACRRSAPVMRSGVATGTGRGAVPRRGNNASAFVLSMAARASASRFGNVSRPAAKYWPAAVGANGQSDPNVTCPGFANASSVGRAAALDDNAVSK